MITALTLAHLLVFVYWLGGDLGAFYASAFVIDPRRTTAERAVALQIMNGVDLAPAVALVLAAPSGLALAVFEGWVPLAPMWLAASTGAGLCWAALTVIVHRGGGPRAAALRRIDLVVRLVFIAMLVAAGACGVARAAGLATAGPVLPLFVALKCWLLAACTTFGLAIRRALRPFLSAFRELMAHGSSPAVEATLANSMRRCRTLVLGIWSCLVAAALTALLRPA